MNGTFLQLAILNPDLNKNVETGRKQVACSPVYEFILEWEFDLNYKLND